MNMIELILSVCFWCSVAGILYAYIGYPAAIWILSRLFGKAHNPPAITAQGLPRVTLLIAAYNEETVIERRIQNALSLNYPSDRFEIVIASDGSGDATASICRRYSDRVRLFDFPERRGKAAVLNAAIEQLDTDIIVFSDANTSMDAAALRHLVRWFSDPSIGVVCGRLVLTDPETGRNADSLYWRYETFLKRCESRLNGLLGANGAIYALRRSQFVPLPMGTLVDDFVGPLLVKMRSGCRIIYDTEAAAFEETAHDLSGEYRRRARIGTGGFQAIKYLWLLLHPRFGWTAFTFWSHKVLRWICPFFMISGFFSAVLLSDKDLYFSLLLLQVIFYVVCAFGAGLKSRNSTARLLRVLAMFVGMNFAILIGFVRWLSQTQSGLWKSTDRRSTGGEAVCIDAV